MPGVFLDQFDISSATAGATFGKCSIGPAEVEPGAKKFRLLFACGGPDPTISSVYIERIEKTFWGAIKQWVLSILRHKFVRCRYRGQTIFFNINSLSNRLGVSRSALFSASEEEAENLIKNSYAKLLATKTKVERQYQKIDKGQVFKPILYQMIGIATVKGCPEKGTGIALKRGRVLYLRRQSRDSFPLMTLFTDKVLGYGCKGIVRIASRTARLACLTNLTLLGDDQICLDF